MPGFDKTRVVGKTDKELNGLLCGVCRQILVDPLVAKCCQQMFCRQCIKEWLISWQYCPFDRKPLTADSGLDLPPRLVFDLLDDMTVKCDHHSDGCEDTISMSELAQHLKVCRFNLCETCGGRANDSESHDCLQYLIDRRNQQNLEIESLKKRCEYEMRLHCNQDIEELQIKDIALLSFGSLKLKCDQMIVNQTGVVLTGVRLSGNNIDDISIDAIISFGKVKEIKYCSAQTWDLIVFKPNLDQYREMKAVIRANSLDLSEDSAQIDTRIADEVKPYVLIRLAKRCPHLSDAIIRMISSSMAKHLFDSCKLKIITESMARDLIDGKVPEEKPDFKTSCKPFPIKRRKLMRKKDLI